MLSGFGTALARRCSLGHLKARFVHSIALFDPRHRKRTTAPRRVSDPHRRGASQLAPTTDLAFDLFRRADGHGAGTVVLSLTRLHIHIPEPRPIVDENGQAKGQPSPSSRSDQVCAQPAPPSSVFGLASSPAARIRTRGRRSVIRPLLRAHARFQSSPVTDSLLPADSLVQVRTSKQSVQCGAVRISVHINPPSAPRPSHKDSFAAATGQAQPLP